MRKQGERSTNRILSRYKKGRRRALSSVVGGIIIFGMIFTVGFGYFYSITQSQQAYQKTLKNFNQTVSQRESEALTISTSATGNKLQFAINNTGIAVTITAYWITNSTKIIYENGTSSIPSLPLVVSQGGYVTFNWTGITVTSTYLIKVLTLRGNTFTAPYPPTATSLAAQALSSGAIGDLYLAFQTYTWYNESTTNCPTGGTSSGYCLNTASGKSAFTIPSSVATLNNCPNNCGIAFSAVVTNLNPNKLNITLDEYSLIMQLTVHAGSGTIPIVWYIVSNSSKTILANYQPVVLRYNIPTFLLFASLNPVCASGSCGSGNNFAPQYSCGNSHSTCVAAGYTAPVFLVSHGWKGIPTSQTQNYGQNSPYVTTLYT